MPLSPPAPPAHSSVYSSTYVRLLFDYLTARGLDAEQVLGEAPPDATDRGLGRYSTTHWRKLLEQAADVLHDPLLGLHLGQTITPAHLGVLGYMLLACRDIREVLVRWQRYEHLIADVAQMDVRLEGQAIVVEWSPAAVPLGPLVDEAALTAVLQFARNLTNQRIVPEVVLFINPEPANLRPYRQYFGCPVRFGQPVTAIRLPAEVLVLPMRQPDATLLEMMERQAQALLAELPSTDDIVKRVQQSIIRLAREGEINLERVARDMHLSSRTLHRRLAQSGQNFRRLRDGTWQLLAVNYLGDPRLMMGEIAWLLGYSEPSAFTRAFGRWTGQTPSQYRRALPETGLLRSTSIAPS